VRLFLSPAILEEYTEVLRRPKFGFDAKAIEAFLRDLKRTATMVRPTQRITRAADEPDNCFLECVQAAHVDYLVTGNRKHFPFREFAGTTIVTPAEFAWIVAEQLSQENS
jgi:putative PIN family toxin of toxin-antitoxin system